MLGSIWDINIPFGYATSTPGVQYLANQAGSALNDWFNKVVYGDTYAAVQTPVTPGTPSVNVWNTAPSNEQQATNIVNSVVSDTAARNAQQFMQTINQTASNLDTKGPNISWGLVAIVGITLIGVSFVKMR